MTQTIKVQRKDFISRLSCIKEDNISIADIAINRRKLLDVLKLQTQTDADILDIQYGTVSWTDKYKLNNNWSHNDTWHESKVDNELCIQISCNHTTMRFLNRTKVKYGHIAEPIPLNFSDYQNQVTPVLSGTLIDIQALLSALTFTLSCVASEENRPVLNCVLFESGNDTLKLVSADGFRLAIAPINVSGIKEDMAIIHMTDCARLITFLKTLKPIGRGKSKEYPELYFTSDDNVVTFSTVANNITLTKHEMEFPKYDLLIPKDGTLIEFNSDDMLQATKSIAYIANNNGKVLRLQSYHGEPIGKIVLSAQCNDNNGDDQVSNVECNANVTGDSKIAVNVNFLSELLSQFKHKVITLSITHGGDDKPSPSNPMMFHLPDNKTAILMPMFVQWEESKTEQPKPEDIDIEESAEPTPEEYETLNDD